MAENNITGRKAQRRILQQAMDSNESEFIAVYGRRRVGKTFLIREFYEKHMCFEMIGIYEASLKEQLENFAESLGKMLGLGITPKVPNTWWKAFQQLESYIIAKENAISDRRQSKIKGKQTIFLDELPWLNTPRSKFMPALQHFWNSFCSKRKDIILVVSGSAASWMIQHVVRSKGGLHNRLTRQFRLLPFTLAETKQYLQSRNIKSLDHYSIIQIYMAIGGVPYYLSKIEKGQSAAQVIDALCFADSAPLRHEYEQLYRSLFEKSEQHMKIVETLSKTRKGFTRNELLEKTGLKSGGTATHILEELSESGFIEFRTPFGKKSNDALYRLIDEFSMFYLYWIKPLGKTNPGSGYWMTRHSSPKYKTWTGYLFECVCLKHIPELKSALGIAALSTEESPWQYRSGSDTGQSGTQIDLLIDRADNTINLCEMKFYNAGFTIHTKYAKELRNKVAVFREQTGTRKIIFITLITPFGITRNIHANSLEVLDVEVDGLLKA